MKRFLVARSAVSRCSVLLALGATAAYDIHAQSAPGGRYRVVSLSVVSLDRAAQAPLVDTITSASLLTINVSVSNDTIATLSVDSLQLQSTGMVRRAPDAFSHGISVSALLTNGRPLITGDSATACSVERPMASLLPELLPVLPMELRAEQQWSDTLTVTTCRAGLPVTTVSIVIYRTLTGMDSSTVLLEKRATMRASGAAILRAQPVLLTGTGTSESLGVLAIRTRRLESWRGTQSLDVTLTNGQQTRRVVQQVTDTATLIP